MADKEIKQHIIQNDGISLVINCLSRYATCYYVFSVHSSDVVSFIFYLPVMLVSLFISSNEETVLSAITTLMFLTTPQTREGK